MIYYHRFFYHIFKTLWLQKQRLTGLLFIVPAVLLLELISLSHSAYDWYIIIDSLHYEFFYVPLFLIILIVHLYFNHCWVILRIVRARIQLMHYWVVYCLILAFAFTSVVFLSDFGLNWLLPTRHPLTGSSGLEEFFKLIMIFFLIMILVGLLTLLFNNWIRHFVLSAAVVIAVVIIDRYTVGLITFCFKIGYKSAFWETLVTLLSSNVLLSILLSYTVRKKDFYFEVD